MMMTSAPSSSFHDYLAMDDVWTKTDSLSSIDTHEDYFEQSFEEDSNINNNTPTVTNSRLPTVKRPMNAFLLWARGERKRVSSDGYGVSQTSLSKLLGETWRHMSMEEKQPFLDMAETLKKQHHIDHPDYRFKPRQRSATVNKAIAKKHHASPMPQQHFSSMIASPNSSTSSSQLSTQAPESSPISNVTPHPIQCVVLTLCQAIISSASSTSEQNLDWFGKLTKRPQSVIVAPTSHPQSSPSSSRRAVRIQIINKHDDVGLPPSTSLLPMTPSPTSASSFASSLPMTTSESTSSSNDYLTGSHSIFHPNESQQILATVMETSMGYETFHDTSINHLTDLDQHCDLTGWIDTPLSNLGTNSTDMISSPYASYDFLSL